jgi:hypothetical protein
VVVGLTGVRGSWLISSVELVTLNAYGRGANWLILWLKDLAGTLHQLTTGRMGRSSSLFIHVRPDSGLIIKGPKRVVFILTPIS